MLACKPVKRRKGRKTEFQEELGRNKATPTVCFGVLK